MEPVSNTKKCNRLMNSSKYKLNSKISWLFNLEQNAHYIYMNPINVCF